VRKIIEGIALSWLLLILVASGIIGDDDQLLRVFSADGEEIAASAILEKQNKLYISLKDISNPFGGTIKYERFFGRAVVNIRGKEVVFTIDRKYVELDGKEYMLSIPPASISNNIVVPVEFLTEILPRIIGKQLTLDREKWILKVTKVNFVEPDDSADGSQDIPEPVPGNGYRVIIDPGHGGHDVGARTKDGLLEKDLTLMLCQRMKGMLEEREDIAVYLTRNRDNYVAESERVNFANKLRGHIFLSIHFNSSPSPLSHGFRLYVNSDRIGLGIGSEFEETMFSQAIGELSDAKRFLPNSKWIARKIADQLESLEILGEHYKEAPLAVMNDLSMPGVLVEVLFLSNLKDLAILSKPDFVDSVSKALCDSIISFDSVLKDKNRLKQGIQ